MNNGINSTNQLPNQQTNPLPTQLPSNSVTGNSNAGTWLNGTPYTGNNSSAAPSSLASAMAVAAWVQNNPVGNSTARSWHTQGQPLTLQTYSNSQTQGHLQTHSNSQTQGLPHTQGLPQTQGHPLTQGHLQTHQGHPQAQAQAQQQVQGHPLAQTYPQSQNLVSNGGSTLWNPYHSTSSPSSNAFPAHGGAAPHAVYGNYSIPHPLHFHTYGAQSSSSSSSSAATGNHQNPPVNAFPSMSARVEAALVRVRKRRAAASATDKNPKQPRGRPKKATTTSSATATSVALANLATLATSAPSPAMTFTVRPAAFTSMPSAVGSSSSFNIVQLTSMPSTSSGMPSMSTALPPPPKYVPPMISRPILTASMPMPPNWLANMEDSVMSLLTFNTYEIKEDTAEYQTISDMLYPIQVKSVKQIVNPDLWDRFVKTRTDMIRSKTDDLRVLSKLGLSEKEVMRCAHLSMNFRKDPLVIPYSDNMVLLYHCTRSQANVKSILSQGLDERLSSTSVGLLGKGIYFADDPNKSLQYDGTGCIFIFAVLLGDCISVDHFTNQRAFVREPEKVAQQKRNFNDQFFDSIVARPAGHNEYVIYNRYQCCPIYQIKYDRYGATGTSGETVFQSSSQRLPPIAWIPSAKNYAMPIQDQTINWPFFAVDVFTSMGVPPPKDEDDGEEPVKNDEAHNTSQNSIDDNLATLVNLGFNDETKNREILAKFNNDLDQAVNYYLDNGNAEEDATVNVTEPTTIQDNAINTSASSEVDILMSLGFCDEAENREVLAMFNNDVGEAINYFLDKTVNDGWTTRDKNSANVPDSAGSTSANSNLTSSQLVSKAAKPTVASNSIVTIDLIDDDSDCPDDVKAVDVTTENVLDQNIDTILPEDIAEWALDFTDKQEESQVIVEECTICYNETSSWQILECKHKICTACHSQLLTSRSTMSGIRHTFVKCPFCHRIIGTEIGTCPDMKMAISTQHIQCEGFTAFSTLVIQYTGEKFNRTAYLPNNDAGREVLKLLQIAFDRRLCFTVGTSNTTGRENVIVWNIHHKTATHGGVAAYGYPDPEYFDRVKLELKAFGIQ